MCVVGGILEQVIKVMELVCTKRSTNVRTPTDPLTCRGSQSGTCDVDGECSIRGKVGPLGDWQGDSHLCDACCKCLRYYPCHVGHTGILECVCAYMYKKLYPFQSSLIPRLSSGMRLLPV